MIGTQSNAAAIASLYVVEDDFANFAGVVPEGFTYIGSGSYRHAFLGPDGVVYKRNTRLAVAEGYGDNQAEWDNYCNPPVFPEGLRFARCTLHNVDGTPIMAMEYVDKASPMIDQAMRDFLRTIGIYDVFGNNVRMRDGEVILTDFSH